MSPWSNKEQNRYQNVKKMKQLLVTMVKQRAKSTLNNKKCEQ